MVQFENHIQCAAALDAQDPLRSFRDAFLLPSFGQGSAAYFLGNSLGLQPRSVRDELDVVLGQWAAQGVESFFHADPPWMDLHEALRIPMSTMAGAFPHEISIMNQLTVNIHLMLTSFYQPKGKKRKILVEARSFPSDQYALRSHIQHLNLDPEDILLEIKGSAPHEIPTDDEVISAIDHHADEIALVFMGGINYYNGQCYDMASITSAAHRHGMLVGFDLAHAMGNVALDLHGWDVDFACWCCYKYLNGGPGAVAAVYIHERFHQDQTIKRLAGWWGYKKQERFLMTPHFTPEADASGWQVSTPPILQYACLKSSLALFERAGWETLLQKQALMIRWVDFLLDTLPTGYFKRLTPQARGCQVSLLFPKKGRAVFDLLMQSGFIVDWREPDVIRFAPVPLYNSYTEIWHFFERFRYILGEVYLNNNQ